MTENFKSKLGKYLTGNLSQESGVNEPQFSDYNISTTLNIRVQIANELGIATLSNVLIRGSVTSDDFNVLLVYGRDNESNKSFIAVINKTGQLIQVITTFSSGSNLFNIISLQIDEDNRIYGISNDSGTLRVLLLNNILISGEGSGRYSCVLRNNYIVPISNFAITETSCKDVIKKVNGEATYYITGYNTGNGNYTRVVKFKINVGSSNEWSEITLGSTVKCHQPYFSVVLTSTSYNIYSYDVTSNKYVNYQIDDEENVTLVNSIDIDGEIDYSSSQVLYINTLKIYLVVGDSTNYTTSIYYIDNNNLALINTLYWSDVGASGNYLISYYYLQNINNNAFFTEYEARARDNVLIVRFGMILNNDFIYKGSYQSEELAISRSYYNEYVPFTDTYIFNQYNLFKIYINTNYNNSGYSDYLNTLVLIYNNNNYNGLSYENINSLLPKHGVLYNNNNEPIFARNLYNKVIRNNMTTSTVQVPNTLLNNVDIYTENLLSDTNSLMIENSQIIQKNIYETLNINFVNTINMINQNDESNYINNTIGAGRINNSISKTLDYTSVNSLKYKITYSDNSFDIKNVTTPQSANDGYVNSYLYKVLVYVPSDKDITQIDFISNDEATVYCSIYQDQLNGLTNRKYYLINQKVRINSDLEGG